MASAESEGQAKLLDVRYAVLLESLQERYHDDREEALGFRHILHMLTNDSNHDAVVQAQITHISH